MRKTAIEPNLIESVLFGEYRLCMKVLSQIWQGSDTVTKLQIIIWIPLLFIFAVVGLNYLSGNLQVERTPNPTISEPASVNYCSEVTGECYDPEPTWESDNEFPARP